MGILFTVVMDLVIQDTAIQRMVMTDHLGQGTAIQRMVMTDHLGQDMAILCTEDKKIFSLNGKKD